MMKNTILIISFSIIITSCGPISTEKNLTVKITKEESEEQKIEPIELDNGQRWNVDSNMLIFFRTMERDVNQFNGINLAEYKNLSEKLSATIGQLTSNCTMEGKAHDELHKWLLPFIDLVGSFSKASTEKEAGAIVKEIKKSFIVFNQYFE